SAAPLPRRNTVLRPSPSPRELALAPASHNKTREFSKSALGIRRYRRLRKQKGWCQMDAIRCLSLTFLASLLIVPATGSAQGLPGAIVGTVKDPDGAVVPGATVRLSSPALLGGGLQTISSDRGQWRFHVLPPGDYELTVDLSPA